GVAAWAGTGSFALACSASGELFRTGGRGHLLGDPLSGHALVRGAARAALRAYDGVAAPTSLGDRLVEATGAARLSNLPASLQRLAPAELARFAPQVVAAATDGDTVAQTLIRDEAERLAELIRSAAVRADQSATTCRVGGGVLTGSALVRDALSDALGATESLRLVACDGARAAAQLARWVHDGTMPMAGWVR
ncbi:MAG: hypothetical protein KDB80_06725, partial [Planctomycetes bacterium]|nr:hypothetical protein [Planctomycetota bacterium]